MKIATTSSPATWRWDISSPGFHATASALKGQPHELSVVYQITEGPQVKVAEVITVGRKHTRPELIDRQIPFSTGDPLERKRDDEERG